MTTPATSTRSSYRIAAYNLIAQLMWGPKSTKELAEATGILPNAVVAHCRAAETAGVVYLSAYWGQMAVWSLQPSVGARESLPSRRAGGYRNGALAGWQLRELARREALGLQGKGCDKKAIADALGLSQRAVTYLLKGN